jgi:hypothetical protein
MKDSQRAKAMLSKSSNAGSITILDLILCHRVITTDTAWHCTKTDAQWNGIEDPEINL